MKAGIIMDYRKAVKDDISILVELRKRQLIDEGCYEENSIDEELYGYFMDAISNVSLVVWVAEESGRIIATSGVCFFRYPPSYSNPKGLTAYITNVYTELEYRKQGIAADLLKFIMKEINDRGCSVVRLHSSDQGRSMYEKMGFVSADGFMVKKLTDNT